MYFYIKNRVKIDSIEQLILLSKKRVYGKPGEPYNSKVNYKQTNTPSTLSYRPPPYETSGLFRGQTQSWDLIPSSYRNIEYDLKEKISNIQISHNYRLDNGEFSSFSKMAAQQNSNFPKILVEQMVIAQHYGIKTPLLDWTRNIFVAIYFALDLRRANDKEKNLEPFIYHLYDERLLESNIEKIENIELAKTSALVSPLPIDRRVERQFSAFSFHPHPLIKPKTIPIDEYTISDHLFMKLWGLMEGMGFSSSYYFPDYAGLADRIKQGFMI